MEGTVAALDEQRVVKLWDRRDRTRVKRLRISYDAVEASGFALAIPRILQVAEVAGSVLTVQVPLTESPSRVPRPWSRCSRRSPRFRSIPTWR